MNEITNLQSVIIVLFLYSAINSIILAVFIDKIRRRLKKLEDVLARH